MARMNRSSYRRMRSHFSNHELLNSPIRSSSTSPIQKNYSPPRTTSKIFWTSEAKTTPSCNLNCQNSRRWASSIAANTRTPTISAKSTLKSCVYSVLKLRTSPKSTSTKWRNWRTSATPAMNCTSKEKPRTVRSPSSLRNVNTSSKNSIEFRNMNPTTTRWKINVLYFAQKSSVSRLTTWSASSVSTAFKMITVI